MYMKQKLKKVFAALLSPTTGVCETNLTEGPGSFGAYRLS
jgi:hypothetical protein